MSTLFKNVDIRKELGVNSLQKKSEKWNYAGMDTCREWKKTTKWEQLLIWWCQGKNQEGDGWIASEGTCRNCGSPWRMPKTEHSGNQEFRPLTPPSVKRQRRRYRWIIVQLKVVNKKNDAGQLRWTSTFRNCANVILTNNVPYCAPESSVFWLIHLTSQCNSDSITFCDQNVNVWLLKARVSMNDENLVKWSTTWCSVSNTPSITWQRMATVLHFLLNK